MIAEVRNFVRVAMRHPGKAAAIAFWFATGRRMRARGRLREATARLPFVYRRWLRECAASDKAILGSPLQNLDRRSEIGVHLHIGLEGRRGDVEAAVASVLEQLWPHWRLIVTMQEEGTHSIPSDSRISVIAEPQPSSAEGLIAALKATSTAYLVPLRLGCRLPREALGAYAAVIQSLEEDAAPILYGDQDEIDARDRRTNPWFKPDWDSDMFLAQDYLSASCALPVTAARLAYQADDYEEVSASDRVAVYALLLRMAVLGGQSVCHLHRVTASTPQGDWCESCQDRLAILRGIVAPKYGLQVSAGVFGTASIRWPLPDSPPLVSIIVPTRDRLDLLKPCVEGILERTQYRNFELIVVDNGSVEDSTREFLDMISINPQVRVASWPSPYNYSAINNFAVGTSEGDFVCLLNNDIEIIDGEWLGELMRHVCRPGIGAVGARLLYPDRSIQHAGITIGLGNAAGHAHRGLAEGEPGHFAHALIARRSTAVTAACLVVSREMFDAVGGLDEQDLRIAYNDVDFCLKLQAAGAVNVYVSSAVLIHHESKSRGLDMAPEHRDRYLRELAVLQQRWDTARFHDPTHHPALDRLCERYLTVQ